MKSSRTSPQTTEQTRFTGGIKAEDFQIKSLEANDDNDEPTLDDLIELEASLEMEADGEDFDEQGLAPLEDTPSTLRMQASQMVQIENIAGEIDIEDEQLDAGDMNEEDARETGYLDADDDLEESVI